MPDIHQVKQEAEQIRRQLLEQFSGKDRLQKMSFDEKRQLLHWLFDGKDREGKPYGIYVNKRGYGQGTEIDYYLYGRITGLRTLKGDDINYQAWDESEDGYKTNSSVLYCRHPQTKAPMNADHSSEHPPAEPKALPWLAHQRGPIASEKKKKRFHAQSMFCSRRMSNNE